MEVKDPNTWPALLAWADTVEAAGYESLAQDARAMVGHEQTRASRQETVAIDSSTRPVGPVVRDQTGDAGASSASS